jgi:hypothetical protein
MDLTESQRSGLNRRPLDCESSAAHDADSGSLALRDRTYNRVIKSEPQRARLITVGLEVPLAAPDPKSGASTSGFKTHAWKACFRQEPLRNTGLVGGLTPKFTCKGIN